MIEKITPFIVMDILARARKIPDAVHLEVGEPDLSPPPAVTEAYVRAVRDNKYFYTPACGMTELREKIAEHYLKVYGVKVSPSRVVVTPGTSGAFLLVLAMFAERRKHLILSDPAYPCYKNFAHFFNIEADFVTVGRETNYEIEPARIAEIRDAGAVMLSSPSNPTGTVASSENIRQIAELCDERAMMFISDEIYHGLVYDSKEHTALEYSDNAIVINSFSKYFCMPGIRLGWMILPEQLVRQAEILTQNLFIGANTPAQYAALSAFDYSHLTAVRDEFRIRRDFMYRELSRFFEIDAKPEGAFYIWADISRYSNDALKFCSDLLEGQGVAITPGVDFGSRWTNRVRFAYTKEVAELRRGIDRIELFINSIRK